MRISRLSGHSPGPRPLCRRRGAAQLRAHSAERSVLERRGQFRRSQQRRRERHHFRALVVGRAALRQASRVLSRDGDLRAQARAHDDGDGAWIRGNPGRREQVLEQLLRLDLRLQQRRLARHPGCRLSRNRHLLVREPEGQGGSLDQASHLRTDRQRIADLRRHDRRRRSRARVHHQGTLRLRADGRAQPRHAVDVSPDFPRQQVRQLHARPRRWRHQRRRADRPARKRRLVGTAAGADRRSGLDVPRAADGQRRRPDARRGRQRRRAQRRHHVARGARLRAGLVRAAS